MKKRVLCIVPTLPKDLKSECISSILAQSYPVDMVVILPKKVEGRTLAARISFALNEGISHIRIEDFDYILRVDGDTILDSEFLKESLNSDADLYGKWGYAMLIKTKPFLKLMNGRFHPESDDTYIVHKFMVENLKVVGKDLRPVETRKKKHEMRDLLESGKIFYELGYEPLHVLAFFKSREFGEILQVVIGYFLSLVKREHKFDIAEVIWHYQVTRLLRLR